MNDVSPFEEETVDMVEHKESRSEEDEFVEREVVEQNENDELDVSDDGYRKQME